LFVEAASEAEARQVLADVIAPTLAPKADLGVPSVERYWKIPEWFEVTLDLAPLGRVPAGVARGWRATFARIVALAGAGWTPGGDADAPDAVWNATPGVLFLAPEVRWAHLQLWSEDIDAGS